MLRCKRLLPCAAEKKPRAGITGQSATWTSWQGETSVCCRVNRRRCGQSVVLIQKHPRLLLPQSDRTSCNPFVLFTPDTTQQVPTRANREFNAVCYGAQAKMQEHRDTWKGEGRGALAYSLGMEPVHSIHDLTDARAYKARCGEYAAGL